MILLVHGEGLFGQVDIVPGWFYVATQFHHICLIPVIPGQSMVVVWEEGSSLEGSYKGVALGRDARSIRLALLEGLATLPAVVGGSVGLFATILERGPCTASAVGLGLFLVGVAGLLLLRRVPRLASYERAVELGKRMGLRPEHMVRLEQTFGRIDEDEAEARVAKILAEREAKAEARQEARQEKQDARLEAEAKAKGLKVEELKAKREALKAKAPKRSPRPRG